jgi:hypothetical protein
VFALLNDLGGYLLPGTPQPADLTPLVTRLLLVNGAPLFDVYLERDVVNRTRLAVFLDLPRRYGHTARLLHRPYPEVSPFWNSVMCNDRVHRVPRPIVGPFHQPMDRDVRYMLSSQWNENWQGTLKYLDRVITININK